MKYKSPKIKKEKKDKIYTEDCYKIKTENSFLLDDDGEKADKYYFSLLNKGYHPLYHDAPYHWAVVDVKKRKIITYTEGDITKETAENEQSFRVNLGEFTDFWKENDSKVYGDIKYNRDELKI